MALRTASLVALAAVLLAGVASAQWTDGRATFYADTNDYWQMSQGSCMYGFLKPDRCTGWDVAALSDKFPGWGSESDKSCGQCYEVKCRPASFNDGYGVPLDRTQDCNSGGGSVVVQVVDTCACEYAPNAFSNKRWCCGDMPHFDLSVWAFEKLGPKGKGVIAVSWRKVDCGYRPSDPAQTPGSPTPMNPSELAGTNAAATDGRPCAGASVANRRQRIKLPGAKSTGVRLSSWSMNKWNGQGVTGRAAQACGTVMPWGGLTMAAGYGSGKQLVFWVKADNVGSLSLKAYGNGGCQTRSLGSLKPVGTRGAYKKYSVNTRNFGCSGVNKMTLNNGWKFQSLCVDGAKLV